MAFNHGFEVKPLSDGTYELIPTQFLFAVANTEEEAWELAAKIDATIQEFMVKDATGDLL